MAVPVAIPASGAYRLDRVRLPACLVDGAALSADADGLALASVDVSADGRIAAIAPFEGEWDGIDGGGRMMLPAFVDVHTHLDKGHIAPRQPNPDGTFIGALTSVAADRAAHWTADDVRARMDFSLRTAFAQGTAAIRTHIDSVAPQHRISWPVFAEMKQEWAGRIALQASPLYSIEHVMDDAFLAEIADIITPFGGPLGAVTYMVDCLDEGLDRMFRLASDRGFDLDFHVDETEDPGARSLRHIAETAKRFGFEGKILCGHCCSLAVQPEDEAKATLDLLAETGIAIVSLPMCNMYLQDRHAGRTPRWRGVTLLHEMKARGIPVTVASDNTRDPFYAYGDMDVWEVYRSATRTVHFDHPFDDWIRTVTATPAEIMRLDGAGQLAPGGGADFVLFRGRSWSEALSRAEKDRNVVRQGRVIDSMLPDYSELDAIVGPPAADRI
ncbi:MAG: cytosine deaminase [Rhodobiaceae bacterium]|nr:cytosine deaminase [Rhodobiaceae bacterium]